MKMSVGMQFTFSENTVDDYDKVVTALNFPTEWPDGLIAHTCCDVDGGILIDEIWETRGHYDRFAGGRLGTAIAESLGDRARPPVIAEAEIHAFHARI
jgi:hypothetical protein